jgi:hypothetical protein
MVECILATVGWKKSVFLRLTGVRKCEADLASHLPIPAFRGL